MPFLQSSGAISINDIRNMFGGPSSPSLGNYYRGGAYIPSSKTVSTEVRDPTSGDYRNSNTYWDTYTVGGTYAAWFGSSIYPGSATSITVGGFTYYRGTLRSTSSGQYGTTNYFYGIYRTSGSTSTVSINTGVPGSGQISLSQFYGAEKP